MSQAPHNLLSALGGAVTLIEAVDTTFVGSFLSNIGANIARADAGLVAVGSIFVVFLVGRLMEDRRRFAQLSQMVRTAPAERTVFHTNRGDLT